MEDKRARSTPPIDRVLVSIFKYHGDVLLTSPLYTTLKRAYPDAKIDLVLFKDTLPMLEGHPAIAEFLTYDQKWRTLPWLKRMREELGLWKRVRKGRYDLVINLTAGDRGAFIAKVSGAKIRIGMESSEGFAKKNAMFTHLIRAPTTPRHVVEIYYDALRAIGILPEGEERRLVFHIEEAVKARVKDLIPFEDFILIHPASRCSYKLWPEERFTAVIQRLLDRGERVIISGGPHPDERAFIDRVLAPINSPALLSLAGQISLKELGALIEASKLLVSVDSVPPHIACALQKPVVVLFGPSDDLKWGPWQNPNAHVVRQERACKRCDQEGCGGTWISDCLLELSAEQVLTTINRALNQGLHSGLKILV